jgi:hypothetical protein
MDSGIHERWGVWNQSSADNNGQLCAHSTYHTIRKPCKRVGMNTFITQIRKMLLKEVE